MTTMSGAEALIKSIKANGVDTLFALPGVQLDNIFEALHNEGNSIRVIHSRHEQGAAYMAYGYAQSTGNVGAYLVVPGPGVLNTSTALCTAHSSNAPVLALTGQIPTKYIDRGLGILHEVADQPGAFKSVTKWQGRAERAGDAPAMIDEAFRRMRSGRPGPVFCEMAVDVTYEKSKVTLRPPAEPEPAPDPDLALVGQAAKLLGESKNPMICIGGGVIGAEAELLALAEKLQAPVISTKHGKGAISDRHYLSHTSVGGAALWPDIDVVLAVGTRLLDPYLFWGIDDGIKIIRIDIDPVQIDKPASPDIKLVTSAKTGLLALAEQTAVHNRERPSREDELRKVQQAAYDSLAVLEPQKSYSDVLRAALPDDGILVPDITQLMFYSWFGYPAYQPRTVVYPGYQDSLGYGFATALGVKVAHPDKRVLSICGDGGFMFTMPELSTAVHHGINLVTVIFNDSGFGNVRRTQRIQFDEHYLGSDLTNPDFVALAESFGAVGLRAHSPEELAGRLDEAFEANAPVLIDVPVDEMPAWQPVMPRDVIRGDVI